jgi:CheY-like chemotaxis protein
MSGHSTARVLTVEDDPIVRADLRLILEEAGFDVVPDARDGVEAVELAREHRPDLILMDLNLPGMDGVEATRRILDERDVPIVALTGYTNGSSVDRAMKAGAVAHLSKPFRDSHLVDAVSGALAEHASEDDRRYKLIMIETMLRNGYDEEEIVATLNGEPVRTYQPAVPALVDWVRTKLPRRQAQS